MSRLRDLEKVTSKIREDTYAGVRPWLTSNIKHEVRRSPDSVKLPEVRDIGFGLREVDR